MKNSYKDKLILNYMYIKTNNYLSNVVIAFTFMIFSKCTCLESYFCFPQAVFPISAASHILLLRTDIHGHVTWPTPCDTSRSMKISPLKKDVRCSRNCAHCALIALSQSRGRYQPCPVSSHFVYRQAPQISSAIG